MTNVDYRFTTTEEGSLVFRSTVSSFGLDSVTDKDISSFYTKFSSYSHIDTGLLPVNNTGLLSIRSAGNHMQVAYQYEPGMYRINWGAYEGDSNAQAYYVAQPYRIVVGDFLDGNFLGARIFYTVEPVTHPRVQLYHVNLPNINCKGYRGNGVGWTCLYRNHDVTDYPFNEKLLYLLERCSGVEAYNDANMSETDGPRFYKSHYQDDSSYSYLWNPSDWQTKSENEGYAWTINPELWIPIKVKGIDDQSQHCEDGIDFTFYEALLGNYSAYYYDDYLPKPINALARNDIDFDNKRIFDWFKLSYNSSQTEFNKVENLNLGTQLKTTFSTSPTMKAFSNEEENEDEESEISWICESCGSGYSSDIDYITVNEEHIICYNCSDKAVWSEYEDQHIWADDSIECKTTRDYFSNNGSYEFINCFFCGAVHINVNDPLLSEINLNLYVLEGSDLDDEKLNCCSNCISTSEVQNLLSSGQYQYTLKQCILCTDQSEVPIPSYIDLTQTESINFPNIYISSLSEEASFSVACNYHYAMINPSFRYNPSYDPYLGKSNIVLCICGKETPISDFESIHPEQMPWSTFWLYFSLHEFIPVEHVDKFITNTHPDYSYRNNLDEYDANCRMHLTEVCSECANSNHTPYDMSKEQRFEYLKNTITSYIQNKDIHHRVFYGFNINIESLTSKLF